MAEPKTIRINDVDNPDRVQELEARLKRSGQRASEVFRHLADAYIRFVDQHGHGPTFPVQLQPFEPPRAVKKKS